MDKHQVQRLIGLGLLMVILASALVTIYLTIPHDPTPPRANSRVADLASPSTPRVTPRTTDTSTGDAATNDGPGSTQPGVRVVVQLDTSGVLEVVEDLRLNRPVIAITVAPPVVTTDEATRSLKPRIVGLHVTALGVTVGGAIPPTISIPTTLRLGRAASSISLRYRLEGSTVRTEPSPLGRALVVMPPIGAGSFAMLPVIVTVISPGVRNLLCPQRGVDQQLCGRQLGQTWSTQGLTGSTSSVIAQVDLPPLG